jgi:cobalt/nickel transport system ATP-binding protein
VSQLNGEVPVVAVDNLEFKYPDGQPALRSVSFSIRPGEKVALVGPNGAGKSTLLLHLNGILRGSGDVRIADLNVCEANLGAIRAAVGLVFQNPDDQLFSPTVIEDVAFGPLHMGLPAAEVHERSVRALERVGMRAYEHRLSHHLSTGEKKRIAIATVLSMNAEILALDEPTAGLDPRARRTLLRLLHDLPVSMLISTHDLRMVRELLPRTIVLDEGRIVADGLTEELLADAALLDAHGLELD